MNALIIRGAKMPDNCFRCFASKWYDFGGQTAGFRCGAMPLNSKIISNVEGRSSRRADCPLEETIMKEANLSGLAKPEEG